MNIAFTSIGNRPHTVYMILRLRETMPNANLIQISDFDTPKHEGVDVCIRTEYNEELSLFILKAFTIVPYSECLFVGDDTIFQKDVSHLLDDDYEVLICTRPIMGDGVNKNYHINMPYNSGFVITKNPIFWKDCYDLAKTYDKKYRVWLGDQMAINDIIKSGKYKLKEVDGRYYNAVPKKKNNNGLAYVFHYKGDRKEWLYGYM